MVRRTQVERQKGILKTTFTTTTKIVSLTIAPLPDSLFTVPAGYHEYKPAPRRPQTGGAGR